MRTRLAILVLTLLFTISAKGQVNDNKIRQQVLEKAVVDSLFVFGKWTENEQTETRLKYLGQVETAKGQVYKIMNSCWLWGLSRRATSRILIFDDKNKYVGNYCLGMISDLPDRLENGRLIFTNLDNEDCDQKFVSKVDFSNGLPKEIFLKCKGENGDIYSFSTE